MLIFLALRDLLRALDLPFRKEKKMSRKAAQQKMVRTSSFRVEADSLERLEEIANKEDRSLSSVVRRFLREGIERYSQGCSNAV